MFTDLIRRLTAPKPQPLPELDTRLALAGLLVRVAKSDGSYAATEIGRIDRILAKTFEINAVNAAKLRADAERLEHQAPEDNARFAAAIRDSVGLDVRITILAAMWQVALSDGEMRAEEEQVVQTVATLLGVPLPAAEGAKYEAQGATVVPRMSTARRD